MLGFRPPSSPLSPAVPASPISAGHRLRPVRGGAAEPVGRRPAAIFRSVLRGPRRERTSTCTASRPTKSYGRSSLSISRPQDNPNSYIFHTPSSKSNRINRPAAEEPMDAGAGLRSEELLSETLARTSTRDACRAAADSDSVWPASCPASSRRSPPGSCPWRRRRARRTSSSASPTAPFSSRTNVWIRPDLAPVSLPCPSVAVPP
nr:uncharacterized protein LOC127327927 isoform X1 [Lolium perenne]